MKTTFSIALLLLTIILSSHVMAQNKSVMIWGIMHWPPFQYQEQGELKGFAVQWMKTLQKDLPEYRHEYIHGNVLRLVTSIHHSEKMCLNSLVLSKENINLPRTSLPDMIYPTPGLIMLEPTYNALGKPESVSLRQLLEQKSGLLGFNIGGLFGALDAIVDEYQNDPERVLISTAKGTTEGLMKMLKSGRIQFFLDYPQAASYNATMEEVKDWVFVLTKENENFIPSYTYCSPNEWGREMVDRISLLIKRHAPSQSWRSHFIKYLDAHTRTLWLEEMDKLYN